MNRTFVITGIVAFGFLAVGCGANAASPPAAAATTAAPISSADQSTLIAAQITTDIPGVAAKSVGTAGSTFAVDTLTCVEQNATQYSCDGHLTAVDATGTTTFYEIQIAVIGNLTEGYTWSVAHVNPVTS